MQTDLWNLARSCRGTARSVPASLIVLVSLSLVGGSVAAQDPDASADPPSAPQAADEPAEVGESAKESEMDASSSGDETEWKVDDQGREYVVRVIPKYEGYYRWLDEEHVRLANGVTYYVPEHDEENFYARVYRVEHRTRSRSEVSAEAQEEAAEAPDPVSLREIDRLSFVAIDEGLPARGQWRNGFEIADMNGDGRLDIVHGPPRKSRRGPAIFLGSADGAWSSWSEADFGGAPLDYGDVAVADFDGDGHQDVAFAVHLRGVKVFLGDGRGSFSEWSEGIDYQVPGGGREPVDFSSRALVSVDWDLDGRPDLVALGEGPRMARASGGKGGTFHESSKGVVVFLNRGDGTWKRHSPRSDGREPHYGDSIAVADLTGDGRFDFLTATATRGRRDILHVGTEDGGWRAAAIDSLRDGAFLRSVTVYDFDGDGREDMAVGYVSNEEGTWFTGADILLNRDDGQRWERIPIVREPDDKAAIKALAGGDLDGDGEADLVALGGDGRAWVVLGDGEGGFVREVAPEVGSSEKGCAGYHVRLVDLDGDDRDEIVAGFAGEAGSEVMFGESPECPSGGALKAWTARTSPPARPSGSQPSAR